LLRPLFAELTGAFAAGEATAVAIGGLSNQFVRGNP
jgi:hypothetical protein